MDDLLNSLFSGLSRGSLAPAALSLVSSMAFLLRDLTDELLRSSLPLLLVAPLDECSGTLTSEMVGRVGTVGTGVRGVPFIILVSINIIDVGVASLLSGATAQTPAALGLDSESFAMDLAGIVRLRHDYERTRRLMRTCISFSNRSKPHDVGI